MGLILDTSILTNTPLCGYHPGPHAALARSGDAGSGDPRSL